VTVGLYALATDGTVRPYFLGAWPAPFGIVLVLDRLSATMLLLTAVLAAAVAPYAVSTGWDRRGQHFHPLFHFQLMGINGAFLTGDVFNLFVFFEVMLIASYGLLLHGGGPRRLGAGLHTSRSISSVRPFPLRGGLDLRGYRHAQHGRPAARRWPGDAGDAALLRTGRCC
jgi:multicomponent K+:H+ antiporter subunit D